MWRWVAAAGGAWSTSRGRPYLGESDRGGNLSLSDLHGRRRRARRDRTERHHHARLEGQGGKRSGSVEHFSANGAARSGHTKVYTRQLTALRLKDRLRRGCDVSAGRASVRPSEQRIGAPLTFVVRCEIQEHARRYRARCARGYKESFAGRGCKTLSRGVLRPTFFSVARSRLVGLLVPVPRGASREGGVTNNEISEACAYYLIY